MADLRDFIPAVKYGASLQNSKLDSGKILLGNSSNLAQEFTLAGDGKGIPFTVTTSVGTSSISTGTVTLLADSVVTGISSTAKVYLTGWRISAGATAIESGTGTIYSVKSGSATGTTIFSFGTTLLTASAFTSSGTGYATYNTPWTLGGGGDAGVGVVITNQGTITDPGSAFTVTLEGIIK